MKRVRLGMLMGFLCVLGCSAPAAAPAASSTTGSSNPSAVVGTGSPNPSAGSSATPTSTLPATGGFSARAATVPVDHRFVASAEATVGRIWLVDLARGTSIDVVAAKGEPQETYFAPSFSESADGHRLLVGASGPNARSALYLVDLPSGQSKLLYEDPEMQCSACLRGAISADGDRYAFADLNGIRVGQTSGGSTTQLVPHVDRSMVGGMWQLLEWSPDATWLAVARGSEGGSEISLAEVATGRLTTVGAGSAVAWRKKAPRLVVTDGANAFGGRAEMYTFEPTTGERRQLEPAEAGKRFSNPSWHPAEDRILFLSANGPYAEGDVYVRSLGASAATSVGAPRKVWEAWWSRDGSRIYGLAPRKDAIGAAPGVANLEILDLPSGRIVATVCRQDPRASCP
jgi:Tol biopolymer transport system component